MSYAQPGACDDRQRERRPACWVPMSKRTRHADNSKRQQPVQQQRAQARQLGSAGPSKSDERKADRKQPAQK